MTRPYAFILHGDAEAAVIDIIKNFTPELTSFSIDKVTTDMVGYEKGLIWVLVELEGGSYKFFHQKRSRVDITVYGPDGPNSRAVAYDISAIIQASLFGWQTGYVSIPFNVNFQSVQIETDIFRGNDKDEDPVRYIQSLRLLVLPAVPS